MAHDHQLPLIDRDGEDVPRRRVIDGRPETDAEYVRRLAIEEYGMPPDADEPDPKRPWRHWMNEEPPEVRLEKIFTTDPREPGEEG